MSGGGPRFWQLGDREVEIEGPMTRLIGYVCTRERMRYLWRDHTSAPHRLWTVRQQPETPSSPPPEQNKAELSRGKERITFVAALRGIFRRRLIASDPPRSHRPTHGGDKIRSRLESPFRDQVAKLRQELNPMPRLGMTRAALSTSSPADYRDLLPFPHLHLLPKLPWRSLNPRRALPRHLTTWPRSSM